MGSNIYLVVLVLWMKQVYESPKTLSNLLAIGNLPIVFFGMFLGLLIDRYSKKKIILWSDFASGFVLLVAYLILRHVSLSLDAQYIVIAFLTFLLGATSCLFESASAAILPFLVEKKDLAQANALHMSTDRIGSVVAQMLGGFFFSLFGLLPVMLANGISFVFSAVSEALIEPIRLDQRSKEQSPFQDFKEGFQHIFSSKGLKEYTALSMILNFSVAFSWVTFPFYVEDYLGKNEIWFVYILALQSLGIIVYSFASTKQKDAMGHYKNLYLGLCIIAVTTFMFLFPAGVLCLLSAFVLGLGKAMINTSMMTTLQNQTEEKYLGRVISVYHTVCFVAYPLGIAFWGRALEWSGRNYIMTFTTVALVFFISTVLVLISSRIRSYFGAEIHASK